MRGRCSVGRAYLYGLSAGGEAGVIRALEILRSEFVRAMQLSGCSRIDSINGNLIRRQSWNPGVSLKERITSQRALLGLQVTHPNPPLAEMAAMCGYDFLMLDEEHGVFSRQDYLQTLQAISATNTLSIVRLAGHDGAAVGRYMDMGVDAIMAPGVSSAAQVQALVRAMEYPPVGTRGFGASLHRATRYGMTLAEHVAPPQRRGVDCDHRVDRRRGEHR